MVRGKGTRQRTVLCLTVAAIVAVYFVSAYYVQPANSCYGPCVIANISSTQIYINQTVTVTGQICPPGPDKWVRVVFTRPNFSYIERDVLADPTTGNFTVTQKLDTSGYWNIFAINGVICDRLFAQVTDPSNPNPTLPPSAIPLVYHPNWIVIGAATTLIIVGVAAFILGLRNMTIKISSLRLLIQIGLLILIFAGVFIDHQYLSLPVEELSPHESLVATSALGVSMPDGLPAPFFACYYPCGRTVTCALWQIQTYIYPFFNVGGGWGVHYSSTGLERLAIVFGVLILAAFILGRVFCGWVCPFGLYLDLMTRLRKFLRIKRRSFSDRTNQQLHQLSYVILAAIIIVSVLFGSEAIAGAQLVPGTQKGGFVWDYYSAPFCQVCPMKPFCMLADVALGLQRPYWVTQTSGGEFWQLGFYLTSINLIILALVTVAAFFFRRSWCRICPLGGLIGLFNRFPPFKWISGVRLNKKEEKCKKCGICKRVCPTQSKDVYERKSGDVASAGCIWCLRCVEMCPYEDCLEFKFAGKTVCKSRNWLANSGSRNVDGE
jgi:Pyruvate/2-oxoacid:ferredoxin oxidoreductase delta subunit